jgi:hypothetical protein
MLIRLFPALFLSVGLLFSGVAAEEKPAAKDCCAKKLACCTKASACCDASSKLGCCAKGQECCAKEKGCCAAVQECCREGGKCCDEAKACCGASGKKDAPKKEEAKRCGGTDQCCCVK